MLERPVSPSDRTGGSRILNEALHFIFNTFAERHHASNPQAWEPSRQYRVVRRRRQIADSHITKFSLRRRRARKHLLLAIIDNVAMAEFHQSRTSVFPG